MKASKIRKQNRRLNKQKNILIKSVKKDVLALNDDTLYEVFKRGDYSFLKSLFDIKNNFHRRVKKMDSDTCHVPKGLKKLIDIDSKIWFNKRITDSKPVYFKGDILITDPCYVFKYVDKEKVKYIERDTIYGDWGCRTYDIDTKEVIGRFCADSGMVAVISLDDVLKLAPNFDDYKSDYAFTVIRNFDGYVKFIVREDSYEDAGEKFKDYNVHVVGKGNLNFITSQTEL